MSDIKKWLENAYDAPEGIDEREFDARIQEGVDDLMREFDADGDSEITEKEFAENFSKLAKENR